MGPIWTPLSGERSEIDWPRRVRSTRDVYATVPTASEVCDALAVLLLHVTLPLRLERLEA